MTIKYYSKPQKIMNEDEKAHYRYLRGMENIEIHDVKRLEAIGMCCIL